MDIKLFDSELKVMEVLWEYGDLPAGKVAKLLKEEIGWNRNTTYTVIKKCIEKKAIERYEPNFMCKPIIERKQIQDVEMNGLIDKLFDGSNKQFFAAFLDNQNLSKDEISDLKKLVEKLK